MSLLSFKSIAQAKIAKLQFILLDELPGHFRFTGGALLAEIL